MCGNCVVDHVVDGAIDRLDSPRTSHLIREFFALYFSLLPSPKYFHFILYYIYVIIFINSINGLTIDLFSLVG